MLPNGAWWDGTSTHSGSASGGREAELAAQLKQRENASMETVRRDYFKNWAE